MDNNNLINKLTDQQYVDFTASHTIYFKTQTMGDPIIHEFHALQQAKYNKIATQHCIE